MFGRLHYTPDQFNRMSFQDMLAAIEGFNDAEMGELNKLRHTMWAPIAAMGGKATPKQLIPLPALDGIQEQADFITKQQFLMLQENYRNKHKPKPEA